MFTLEKGIQPSGIKRGFGQLKYPWDKIQPGESFVIKGASHSKNSCVTSGTIYFKSKNIPAELKSERIGNKEYRIFRIK